MPSMAEAFMQALVKFAEVQMQFASNLSDVNVKRSAALMGSRGGRRTQAKKKAAGIAASCKWCQGDSSVTALEWHRNNHLNGGAPSADAVSDQKPS